MTNYIYYGLTYALILLLLLGYGKSRCMMDNFNDILSYNFTSHIDGWVVSHFISYIIIGFLFPETFYLSMFLGIMWELFEVMTGIYKPRFMKGIGDCGNGFNKKEKDKKFLLSDKNNSGKQTYWWYGQYEDVIANCLGFIVGKYLFHSKFPTFKITKYF